MLPDRIEWQIETIIDIDKCSCFKNEFQSVLMQKSIVWKREANNKITKGNIANRIDIA